MAQTQAEKSIAQVAYEDWNRGQNTVPWEDLDERDWQDWQRCVTLIVDEYERRRDGLDLLTKLQSESIAALVEEVARMKVQVRDLLEDALHD